MSRTCIHSDADAVIHPECPGCAALIARMVTDAAQATMGPGLLATNATRAETSSGETPPVEDIARTPREQRAQPERQEPARRDAVQARVRRELVDGGTRHELPRPSLLAARELTPEECAARDAAPRPGTWYGDEHADGRALTQDETDTLIRNELVVAAPSAERNDVRALVGTPHWLTLPPGWPADHRRERARVQRGGIDSDPLVRLLAYRAWGDRDNRWFEQRGLRAGDRVSLIGGGRFPYGREPPISEVALAWSGETVIGIVDGAAWPNIAEREVWPGGGVHVRVDDAAVGGMSIRMLGSYTRNSTGDWVWPLRVSDRQREEPRGYRPAPEESRVDPGVVFDEITREDIPALTDASGSVSERRRTQSPDRARRRR